jgi:hypothetical protein
VNTLDNDVAAADHMYLVINSLLFTAVSSKIERWITYTHNISCVRYMDLTIMMNFCKRLEVLMLVTIIINVFWHGTLCTLVKITSFWRKLIPPSSAKKNW